MLLQSRVFHLVSVALLTAFSVFGQLNASLQGVITDPTGGLIPGAQVQLKNNGTNATMTTTTNDQGFYRFNQLPAGTYTLTVSAPNFQTNNVTNVAVAADLPQTADATLQPGNIQSEVTVTASSIPTLQTADASVSGTIGHEAVENLPSFGRDPYELIRTMPGIDSTGGRSGNGQTVFLGNTSGPGQSNVGIFQTENQVQVSSAGQRVEQNVFYIDGVNVNSLGWGGAAVVTPNTESVQDITVVTADYDAGDGRGSGAHIKTTSRAGTNQFHGSGVFVYQDPNFNAYNKWGGPNNSPPVRVQNNYRQYAGSLGGPIKKDKLFFFASYEGLKNKTIGYAQGWVTTQQYRNLLVASRPGTPQAKIFQTANATPRILAVLGGPGTTCAGVFTSSATAVCRDVNGGLDLGSPGPGVANTPYYPISPDPLSIGAGFDGIPDIQDVEYYIPGEQVGNQFNGRVDYNLTSKDMLFGSFYLTHLNSVSAGAVSPSSDVFFKPTNTAVTLGYVRNVSATVINELRGNFTRFADNQINDNPGTNFGIPQIQVESYPFGNIQVAGVIQSSATPGILAQNTYEIRDTLTKVLGQHTIRVGGEFRWEQDNNNLNGQARPLYSFSGLWNLANGAPIFEQLAVNAFTGGAASSAFYFRDHIGGLYVQDDWHMTPSFTLNLGMRWEVFTPISEARGNLFNIFLGQGAFGLVNAQLRRTNQLWNTNWHDFEPRIGFAYAPTAAHQKVVVRGGFGILYNRQNDAVYSNIRQDLPTNYFYGLCCGTAPAPYSFGTPFAGGQILFATGSSNTPTSYPANPLLATGVNATTGTPNGLNGAAPPPIQVYGAWPRTPDAYTDIYSLETQTQVAKNITFILGYQGAISRHLIRLVDENFLYNQSIGTQNSFFSGVFIPTPDVNASYNAMYARVTKSFSQGFSVDATYTWSKSIDMLSAEGPGGQTNQTDPVHAQTTEYGPSDYDSRHRFVFSGLWTLPIFPRSNGLLHAVLGGWQLGGITTAYSGFPWTPVTGQQSSQAALPSAATILPVRPTIYYNNANPNDNSNTCFINGCEFGGTNPTIKIVGTNYFAIKTPPGPPGIGRNSFRGPGFFSTDATLSKKFAVPMISEAAGVQLELFAFNVFNQLNLVPLSFIQNTAHVEDPNFGRPSGALAGRSVELQVRITF
jgi:hypothetical protein